MAATRLESRSNSAAHMQQRQLCRAHWGQLPGPYTAHAAPALAGRLERNFRDLLTGHAGAATVDDQGAAGDIVGGRGGQEHAGADEVLGHAQPP